MYSCLLSGVMVMTSLFGGIFGGMSVVWDRHFPGNVHLCRPDVAGSLAAVPALHRLTLL